MWTVHSDDPQRTHTLGAALGAVALPSTVVALVGDLGAGKTCFAQGVGEGLGVQQPVVSPTFVLMAEYPGRLPLLHADTYRIAAADLPGVGLEETLEQWEGVALLEWADRFPDLLPADHLQVLLQHTDGGRTLTVSACGPRHLELLASWRAVAGV